MIRNMKLDGMYEASEDLSIQQAARWWGVTVDAVYAWANKGTITLFVRRADGWSRAKAIEVFRARVLRSSEVLRRLGLDDNKPGHEALGLRIGAAGIAIGEGRKLSLQDLADLRRFEESETEDDRRAVVVDVYLRDRLRPGQLPGWFWNVEERPRFVPPVGVFKISVSEPYEADAGVLGRTLKVLVTRTAGYEKSADGGYRQVAARRAEYDECDVVDDEEVVAGIERDNEQYDAAKRAWKAAWRRARRGARG